MTEIDIDYDEVKRHLPTYKHIADHFWDVREAWRRDYPIVGKALTGIVSDYIHNIEMSKTRKKSMSANFGIKFLDGTQMMSNDLFIFAGNRWHYSKMYMTHAQVLCLCMHQTNLLCPRPEVKKWVVGDCGGRWYTHTYHNGYRVLDINYPTFLNSATHYKIPGCELEALWKEDHYPYRTLIPGLIDLDKLYCFLTLIKRCFPKSQVLVNGAMHKILGKMGPSVSSCASDTAGNNHHRHIHIGLGYFADMDALMNI